MALMVAGKRSEFFDGLSVWAAMTDVKNWYRKMSERTIEQHSYYARQIEDILGKPEDNVENIIRHHRLVMLTV